MTTTQDAAAKDGAARPRTTGSGGSGPPWMSAGMPAERSTDFGPSARRLLLRLAPERYRVGLVLLLALGSVGLSVLGPKIIGRATDVIFAGVLGSTLPGDVS